MWKLNPKVVALHDEIKRHLSDNRRGEMVSGACLLYLWYANKKDIHLDPRWYQNCVSRPAEFWEIKPAESIGWQAGSYCIPDCRNDKVNRLISQ
jgi:hypothetical protein